VVRKITKAAAEAALEKLKLGSSNRAFAGYWLSLWEGDELPRHERFDHYRIEGLSPNLIEFDVLPESRVMVRKAGRETCEILGEDVNGIDWVLYARIRNRRSRMRNLTAIANGAVNIVRRRLTMVSGPAVFNEELLLPFAPDSDGICPVVAHTDWKIDRALRLTGISEIEPLPRDSRLFAIRGRAPAAL
jgi:hypothetical protein